MGMPSNQTPARAPARATARATGWGKSRSADLVTAALESAIRSPATDQDGIDQDGIRQDAAEVDEVDDVDDVALDDLLVQGIRMADLDPATLVAGSAAWNAATAYKCMAHLPHAAAHFEGVAREWAALANADTLADRT